LKRWSFIFWSCVGFNLIFATLSPAVPSLAVSAAAKHLDDGQQVVSKVLLVTLGLFDDGNLDALGLEHVFNELKGKSAKPITTCNRKLSERAVECSVQNGEQSGPFPVDSRAHVGNDLEIGESLSHETPLPSEILSLFAARYSAISDFRRPLWDVSLLEPVETISSRTCDEIDTAGFRPDAKLMLRYVHMLSVHPRRDVFSTPHGNPWGMKILFRGRFTILK
jgi:hypothetical protein